MGIIVRGWSFVIIEIILESVDLFFGYFGCLVFDVKYNCGISLIFRKISKEIIGFIDWIIRLYMCFFEDY